MFVIHYGEIGIKGGNRDIFERRLVSNIKKHLEGLVVKSVRRRTGSIVIEADETAAGDIRKRLQWVSGIEYFYEAVKTPAAFEEIAEAAQDLFKDARGSCRGAVKRADKRFPTTSQETAAKIGAVILESNPDVRVDLHHPERLCFVEITEDGAYVAAEKIRGVGGLPYGSSGKLVSMISGGIDSPVASWMMQKRGAPLHFLHFHNFPYTDRRSIDIVKDAIAVLNRNAFSSRLSLINLTPIQEEIVAKCTPKFRVILYRRMMFRIAERIAEREGAGGIVTGESLGQVASQTVWNMKVIEAVTPLPVLRPLVGMDKEEIIERAKKIGTYDLSIQPHSDCCSLFIPQQPSTKAPERLILADEAKLDVEAMVERALKEEERVEFAEASW